MRGSDRSLRLVIGAGPVQGNRHMVWRHTTPLSTSIGDVIFGLAVCGTAAWLESIAWGHMGGSHIYTHKLRKPIADDVWASESEV